MNVFILVSLGLVVFLQASASLAKSTSNDAESKESTDKEAALSREKRGMGTRSGPVDFPDVPEIPEDELEELLEGYFSQLPETFEEDFLPEDGEDFHPRFRRSTPRMEETSLRQGENVKEPGLEEDYMPVFDDEAEFYPEDLYDGSEEVFEPEEGGEDTDQRSFQILRSGKNAAEDENSEGDVSKRPMSMLRLGKRPMSMLRLGKRPMSMLRLGKRPMSMLRLGKRPMGMLRLGKRPMSMLRLGKRPMSMLRLGKRPMSMLRLGKRPMSMLRLGKRPMRMLRLGKRPMSTHLLGKRSTRLAKQSLPMLRVEKRDAEMPEDKRQLASSS